MGTQLPTQYMGPGSVVQSAYAAAYAPVSTTALMGATGSAVPQNTEGAEIITCSITPKSTSNLLIVTFSGHHTHGNYGETVCVGLFRDSTASALVTIDSSQGTGINGAYSYRNITYLTHQVVAGSLSATTFKVRAGLDYRVGSETLQFGGIGGGVNTWGGTLKYNLSIVEIAA